MSERKPYPSDVSDDEWAFVAPYLTLMDPNAPQREHTLREVFNGLRYVIRSGATWRMMPNDLPPWPAVYQQAQRWHVAGSFEAMVDDLRAILRLAKGRSAQPSAAILDGRTLQSSPESGERAGYDGHKRRRGSKLHLAVDTLGHLLALHVTPANEQERAQVSELCEQIQAVTGGSVELAYVDQGYTGEDAAAAAAQHGIQLEVVKLPEAKKGFVLLPKRWVVERSFAWTARFRRLARDYERLDSSLALMHYWSDPEVRSHCRWALIMRQPVSPTEEGLMAARGIDPVRIELTSDERATLERWVRRRSTAQALALRARIVLACADRPKESHSVLGAELGAHRATIGTWRKRFAERRLAGLKDDPRTGTPRRISDAAVEHAIATTLEQMPPDATHWSTRGLAKTVGMSRSTVGRIWRAFGLQPHRSETFKLSTDPLFVEKVRDIVGLYLDPPTRALVLCVDEKPQIQATEGTAPILPMRPGQPELRTHDYIRHGTRDLFAALDVKAGTVIGEVHARHRSSEFRDFLDTVDANTPADLELHLILDNASTHKTELIKRWLLKRPRVHLHFTPTSASWINLVECWFSILQRRALARASFDSTEALEATLRDYIAATNATPKPFVWTKTADEILASVRRFCQRTSGSDH